MGLNANGTVVNNQQLKPLFFLLLSESPYNINLIESKSIVVNALSAMLSVIMHTLILFFSLTKLCMFFYDCSIKLLPSFHIFFIFLLHLAYRSALIVLTRAFLIINIFSEHKHRFRAYDWSNIRVTSKQINQINEG